MLSLLMPTNATMERTAWFSSSPAYTYTPLPKDGRGHIRLLILVPATHRDAPIQGSFLPCDLDADFYHFRDEEEETADAQMKELLGALRNERFRESLGPEAVGEALGRLKLMRKGAEEEQSGEGVVDCGASSVADEAREDDLSPGLVGKGPTTSIAGRDGDPGLPPDGITGQVDAAPSQARYEAAAADSGIVGKERLTRPFSGTALGRFLGNGKEEEATTFPMPWHYDMSSPEIVRHAFQPYTAISYCWGDAADMKDIQLDGGTVAITHNLYTCLQGLRSKDEGCLIWADALCINQADHVEREAQVRLMSRIYSQAEKVHMYVGPAGPADCGAFYALSRMIQEVGKKCAELEKEREMAAAQQNAQAKADVPFLSTMHPSQYGDNYKLYETRPIRLRDHGLDPDSKFWVSWRRFFASPYFQRAWVLQEVAFAGKLELTWGMIQLRNPYEALSDCMDTILRYSSTEQGDWMSPTYATVEDYARDAEMLNAALLGYRGLNSMFFARSGIRADAPNAALRDTTLIKHLEKASSFQATDDRDRVYAMIGISSDAEQYSPYISYSDPTSTVYRNFARLIIEHSHGLRLLHQAASCRRRLPDAPSWVPVGVARIHSLTVC